jgi:hypothetical protein
LERGYIDFGPHIIYIMPGSPEWLEGERVKVIGYDGDMPIIDINPKYEAHSSTEQGTHTE